MLVAGQKAPSFKLPSSLGDDFSLEAQRGKYVVVYFYPRDDTPGCTVEAQDFRDAGPELASLGAVVVGVSKDTIKSHCRFSAKYALTFPLLSDESGDVLTAYGAWGEKSMYGKVSMGIIRSTAVIDPEGRIVAHFPKVKVAGHAAAVVAAIAAHQSGDAVATPPKAAKKVPAKAAKKAPAKAAKKAPAKAAKKAPAKKAR
jgi:peroxiredoxin Q/BCP